MTSDDRMFRDWNCDECPEKAMFLKEEGEGNIRRVLAHRCAKHMDLKVLARLAQEAFEKLSPEAQKKHRRDQTVSWIYGNLKLDGSAVTMEMVEKIVDERMAQDERLEGGSGG